MFRSLPKLLACAFLVAFLVPLSGCGSGGAKMIGADIQAPATKVTPKNVATTDEKPGEVTKNNVAWGE